MASLCPPLGTVRSRRTGASVIAAAMLGALLVAAPVTTATAAQSPASCPTPVALTNGSFEDPHIGFDTYAILHEDSVPGWRTTASDGQIELWASPFQGVTATSGTQFAELNANQVAALYQDVATQPGQVLKWSLDHRGRAGVDVMAVKLGAPSGPLLQQGDLIADGFTWGSYSGLYTVPAGQTTTRFAFESVSNVGGPGVGNFLDNISLGNAACVVTTKSVSNLSGGSSVEVGDTLQYTVTAENRGGTPATAAIITDSVPAGLTFVPGSLVTSGPLTDAAGDDAAEISGSAITARVGDGATTVSGGIIPAGESRSLTFRVTVDTASSATTILNEATTTYVESLAGVAATSVSNETVTVVADAADVAVSQGLTTALERGQAASYTITVVNNGPQAAADTVLTTTLPPLEDVSTDNSDCTVGVGVIECAFGSLAVGATIEIVVTGTVPADAAGGASYELSSVVTTSSTDLESANNTATTLGLVAIDATIGVTATITGSTPGTTPGSTSPGEILEASYVVTNTGNVELTGITVSDPFFGTVTCAATTLAPGESTTCTADAPYVVTTTDADNGSISTTVTAVGTPPTGSTLVSSTDTVTITVIGTVTVPPTDDDGDGVGGGSDDDAGTVVGADSGAALAVTGVDPAQHLSLALALLLAGAALVGPAALARRRSAVGSR